MRAFLSTPYADPTGHVALQLLPQTSPAELLRRVQRIRTLDGGAAVNDFGVSDADRTFVLQFRPTAALAATLERLIRVAPTLLLCVREGAFIVVPSSLRLEARGATLTLLATEKVSA